MYLLNVRITDNSSCSFCNDHEESVVHLFWHCRSVTDIWNKIFIEIFQSKVEISYENVCFGYHEDKMRWYSFTIFYAKHYIYRKLKINSAMPGFQTFKNQLGFHLNVQRYILINKNNQRENKEVKRIFVSHLKHLFAVTCTRYVW